MVGAAADLMSIHLMEGYVAVVTQPEGIVPVSSGDVFHHQGQQAYGPTLLQYSHKLCCVKKKKKKKVQQRSIKSFRNVPVVLT